MTVQRDLKPVYIAAIVLFVVGVFCYAAFSAPQPEQPLRLMYEVATGNVLFDHKTHSSDAGYAMSCVDCHHTNEPDDDVSSIEACGECHLDESEDEDVPKLADAYHAQCRECHEDYGKGPGMSEEACGVCHSM